MLPYNRGKTEEKLLFIVHLWFHIPKNWLLYAIVWIEKPVLEEDGRDASYT